MSIGLKIDRDRDIMFCGWLRFFAFKCQTTINVICIGGWLVGWLVGETIGVGLADQRSLSGNVQKETNGQLI